MEASRAQDRHDGYMDLSRLTIGELLGMVSALILLLSLWLPWFSTSSENQNSVIESSGTGPGESANAWAVFGILDWLLLAACAAPFILSWIVVRGHELTWRPGEVTMIVGMTAFVLILCNGVILGKPDPGIGVSLSWGYLVALIASIGMIAAGFLRQALHSDAKKPPGVF
jgi:hypothetical protein